MLINNFITSSVSCILMFSGKMKVHKYTRIGLHFDSSSKLFHLNKFRCISIHHFRHRIGAIKLQEQDSNLDFFTWVYRNTKVHKQQQLHKSRKGR